MKILIVLPVFILFFYIPSNVCGNDIYVWYDENGRAHFTHDPPPANARLKSGENWWQEEETSESDTVSEEGLAETYNSLLQSVTEAEEEDQNLEQREEKRKPKKKGFFSFFTGAEEDSIPEEEDQNLEQREEQRKPKKKGFFSFLKRDAQDDNCDKYEWFVENHGICPLDEPKKDVIGSSFKAKVVDNKKRVWSSCKGTHIDDIYTFKNKGEGRWETDGGVPGCPFYESFYWR